METKTALCHTLCAATVYLFSDGNTYEETEGEFIAKSNLITLKCDFFFTLSVIKVQR